VITVGIGFMLVGAIPVAVTFSLGAKSSATIIGVGFIGFGLLLVLPGISWCLVRRTLTLPCCTRQRLRCVESQKKTPALRTSDQLLEADDCHSHDILDTKQELIKEEEEEEECDVREEVVIEDVHFNDDCQVRLAR